LVQTQGEATDPRVAIIGEDSYARAGIVTLIREINPRVAVKASLNNYRALEILLGQYPVDIIILVSGYECDIGLSCLRVMHQIAYDYPSIQLLVYSRRATSFLLRAQSTGWLQCIGEPFPDWRKHLKVFLMPDGATKKEVVSARKGNFILNRDEWLVINDLFAGESLSSIARRREINYRRVSALKMSVVRKLGLRTKNDLLVFLAN
jgi:DNA-binding NarL/FixJ family response regulator